MLDDAVTRWRLSGPGRSGARRRDSYRRCALFAEYVVLLWIRCKTRRALVYDIVRYLGAAIIAGLPHPRSISRYRLIDKNPTIVGTVNNTEHRVTMQTSLIWTYQFSITLMSDLHDLTLSIIDLLTIRSPIWRYNYRKIITTVSHSRTVFKWLGPGQSRHVIDRLGRIGLALGKRTVKVIPYRLSFTETCVTQWQTTLTVSALHFSTLWISASSNAHPVCLSWKKTIHEQQTEVYDLRYCAVAWLKALTTYNLHSATEMYENCTGRNITSFTHKRTNT